MAHGNARVEKWRGKRRMEGVASSLALYRTRCIQHYYRWCAHLGCQQPTELTPPPIKMDSSVSLKYQIWFLRVCHHILFSLYHGNSTANSLCIVELHNVALNYVINVERFAMETQQYVLFVITVHISLSTIWNALKSKHQVPDIFVRF